MLGGLEWAGLAVVVEILGVADVEALVAQLIAIRDWQQEQHKMERT